jgi:hypothetical protein
VHVRESTFNETTGDPAAAFGFVARGGRDLRDGYLRAHDTLVARGESGVRSGQRGMRARDVV